MASSRKRKEQRIYDKLESVLHSIVVEKEQSKDDDTQLELKLRGIEDSQEYYQNRIEELQRQVNVKEMNGILKQLGEMNYQHHKQMLPNIDSGKKRFHMSYAKLLNNRQGAAVEWGEG